MTFDRKNRLRKLTYLPLTAAIIASGALYTGAGVGSAATELTVSGHTWSVENYSGQMLTHGEFYRQMGKMTSSITFDEQRPGQRDSARQENDAGHNLYTWGRVCFNKAWWNLQRDKTTISNVNLYAVGERRDKLMADLQVDGPIPVVKHVDMVRTEPTDRDPCP